MTNEELLNDYVKHCSCSGVSKTSRAKAVELRAELLRRLGAAVSASPQPKYAKCWMVERDSECDPPEFFATEDEATKNACLGLATTHITPLFTSKPFFAAAPAQEPRTNATIHDKLQPCPFCGCLASMNAHGQVFSGLPGYRVECEGDCHAMTCYWHTEEQALTAWNRRAAQEQPVENSPQSSLKDFSVAKALTNFSEEPPQPTVFSPQKGKP